jgi:hypothetical protein
MSMGLPAKEARPEMMRWHSHLPLSSTLQGSPIYIILGFSSINAERRSLFSSFNGSAASIDGCT